MRKVEPYVFRGLIMVCLLIVGCAGLSFGLGGRESGGGQDGVTRAAEVARAARAADVPEVEDIDYVPRRNPAAARATSPVYALPAVPLKPEAERLPPPVYAISGIKGQEISESTPWEVVDIRVDLPSGEAFLWGLVEGVDVSTWILNLPAGLEGRAHGVKKGDTSILIYVAGTPVVTARGEIRVRIPGNYLAGGADLLFISPSEAESRSVWEANQTGSR
jgi:hypothetical protein